MEHTQSIETPRRLRAIEEQRRRQQSQGPSFDPGPPILSPAANPPDMMGQSPLPPGIPAPGQSQALSASYVMPTPLTPLVEFRFRDSDEAAYAVILRRGDRTLDLGVFAAGHRTIQEKTGVRHYTDPDMLRLAEHIDGTWREMPTVEALHANMAWLIEQQTTLAARLDSAEAMLDQLTAPAPEEAEEFDAGGDEFDTAESE